MHQVLHVGGLHWATSTASVETTLLRRPGVASVEANAVNQAATVTAPAVPTPHEMMGHGGYAAMSMDDMVRDMRNRFLAAVVLSIPIMLWSPMGRDMFGFTLPAPLGMRDDVFGLLLSLPVIFYSSWIFLDGAWRALRARTLDMMVLVAVAVAIGAGWLYSAGVTLTGGGEVFYQAASVLATFVLLGHWFEMRARGGANDAIRTLLKLAPPMAVVLRDGEPVEVPTAEVVVGDLLLIRPGAKKDPRRRHGRGGTFRGRRIHGHRREPAGGQGPALSMSGSSLIVAVNALMLKRLKLRTPA